MRYFIAFLITLGLALSALNAQAQFGIIRSEIEYCGKTMICLGTGCLIDHDLVVTCSHVTKGDNWRIEFDGKFHGGKVIASCDKRDVALIRLNRLVSGVSPVTIGTASKGEMLRVGGFAGSYKDWEYQYGKLEVRLMGPNGGLTSVLSNCLVRQGDSGGPVLNGNGHLVGIVWAFSGIPKSDKEGKLLVNGKGKATHGFIKGSELTLFYEILPFLNEHLPGHKGWKSYAAVDPYIHYKLNSAYRVRDQLYRDHFEDNNLPLPLFIKEGF